MKAMTEMENLIMLWTDCNRSMANFLANEILNIDEKTNKES